MSAIGWYAIVSEGRHPRPARGPFRSREDAEAAIPSGLQGHTLHAPRRSMRTLETP